MNVDRLHKILMCLRVNLAIWDTEYYNYNMNVWRTGKVNLHSEQTWTKTMEMWQ